MRQTQNMWVPFITGIGVGAAVSGMMRGKSPSMQNMTKMIPGMNQMTGSTGNTPQNQ